MRIGEVKKCCSTCHVNYFFTSQCSTNNHQIFQISPRCVITAPLQSNVTSCGGEIFGDSVALVTSPYFLYFSVKNGVVKVIKSKEGFNPTMICIKVVMLSI